MSPTLLLVLAVVQGLTEFLPVSSSGHLVLLESWFGLKDAEANLALNVYLHFASVLAVTAYYARDLVGLLTRRRALVLPLVLATIPAGVMGLLFADVVEAAFASPVAVACGWIGTGAALTWGQRRAALDRDAEQLGPWRALGIGMAQAAAILPGLSRSGMTISASLAAGLRADEATRFSFLMAIPVILGAAVLELPEMLRAPGGMTPPVVAAGVVCFAVSYGALALLVRAVRARRLQAFAWYVWALAAVVLGAALLPSSAPGQPESRATGEGGPIVHVAVSWPGANVEAVERELAAPLESLLLQAPSLARLRCVARGGGCDLLATFAARIQEEQARQAVAEKVRVAAERGLLPADAQGPELGVPTFPLPGRYWYTLASDGADPAALRDRQEGVVRPGLLTMPGVADVLSLGGRMPEIRIDLDSERARACGVALTDVIRSLEGSKESRTEPEDLLALTVGVTAAGPVHLRDLAVVARAHAPPRSFCWRDGRETVGGCVLLASRNAAGGIPELSRRIHEVPGVSIVPFGAPDGHLRVGLESGIEPAAIAKALVAASREAPGLAEGVLLVSGMADPGKTSPTDLDLFLRWSQAGSGSPVPAVVELVRRLGKVRGVACVFPQSLADAGVGGVDLSFLGGEIGPLEELARRAAVRIATCPGVEVVRVLGAGRIRSVSFDLSREALARAGLGAREVLDLLGAVRSGIAIEARGGRGAVRIRIADARGGANPLDGVWTRTTGGEWVSLAGLVEARTVEEPAALLREDGRRLVGLRVWTAGDREALRQLLRATVAPELAVPAGCMVVVDSDLRGW